MEDQWIQSNLYPYCRSEYPAKTPIVRLLFCLMAILMMLWDFMLLITVLYFHMMIEKGDTGPIRAVNEPSRSFTFSSVLIDS